MSIKYDKFFHLLKSKGYSTYRIRKDKIISESTLQNMRNNGRITTDALDALCRFLDCQPGDLLEYLPDETEPNQ